jgi:hypothetical protein
VLFFKRLGLLGGCKVITLFLLNSTRFLLFSSFYGADPLYAAISRKKSGEFSGKNQDPTIEIGDGFTNNTIFIIRISVHAAYCINIVDLCSLVILV